MEPGYSWGPQLWQLRWHWKLSFLTRTGRVLLALQDGDVLVYATTRGKSKAAICNWLQSPMVLEWILMVHDGSHTYTHIFIYLFTVGNQLCTVTDLRQASKPEDNSFFVFSNKPVSFRFFKPVFFQTRRVTSRWSSRMFRSCLSSYTASEVGHVFRLFATCVNLLVCWPYQTNQQDVPLIWWYMMTCDDMRFDMFYM